MALRRRRAAAVGAGLTFQPGGRRGVLLVAAAPGAAGERAISLGPLRRVSARGGWQGSYVTGRIRRSRRRAPPTSRNRRARAARRAARSAFDGSSAAAPCRRAAARPTSRPRSRRRRAADPQDRAERERAARAEVLVAGEVARRVGDQAAVVALDAADHVRARADDEVGAGVDHGVREARESPRFSPRKYSVPCGTWVAPEPSAPACMATTTRSACRGAAHERLGDADLLEPAAQG